MKYISASDTFSTHDLNNGCSNVNFKKELDKYLKDGWRVVSTDF